MLKSYHLAATLAMTIAVTGCASVGTSDSAICSATAQDVSAHAAALATDGGDLSVVTGQRLISRLDAGCGR